MFFAQNFKFHGFYDSQKNYKSHRLRPVLSLPLGCGSTHIDSAVIKYNSVLIEPITSCHLSSSEAELLSCMYRAPKSHEVTLVCLQIMIDFSILNCTCCSSQCHKALSYSYNV